VRRTPDGRILTVQCHLEELAVSHEWGRVLIRTFVQAAATGEPMGGLNVGARLASPSSGPP
jgi:hypothetical protein